jgi:hypothetical protein
MIQVYSEALKKTISVDRLIANIQGTSDGPTVVFFSGIHGNEPAGVFALEESLRKIKPEDVRGSIYGVSGNLKALRQKQRYIDEDLNRIWTEHNLNKLERKEKLNKEEHEQLELYVFLNEILNKGKPPYYFIDLHTTSSKTVPFITINDALINRRFSNQFPIPTVLGIEEYLNGPLLSYINSLGYVSLGFESGQHDEIKAISNSISFIYLTLVFTKIMGRDDVPSFLEHFKTLESESKSIRGVFEVIYLHKIMEQQPFKMLNGFENFQSVKKGKPLALSNNETLCSKYNAQIFMPLYQPQGQEGFFIIRKIKPFFLKLSTTLRQFKMDEMLIILPGVSWEDSKKQVLTVNLNTARFLVKPLFHLFGYRNKQIDKTHLKLYNRERTAKTKMYAKEVWYKTPV